jgi:hypothetical protein
MASHGRRGISKLLLGSQATEVVNQSSVLLFSATFPRGATCRRGDRDQRNLRVQRLGQR